MKTRAQSWSANAYTLVSGAKGGARAKYKTSCMKMPGLIHQSGLLQALVFQVARDEAGKTYVDHLAQTYFDKPEADHKRLIQYAQQQELKPYMALTQDLAQIAQWFRKFAQIELAAESED
jgi:CRISPR type III-B/RAMP module-associated protein Cmr5